MTYPFWNQNKYHNKKVTVDGYKFDSIKEGEYYSDLLLAKRAQDSEQRVISFEMQVPFVLQDKYKYQGKTIRAIKYFADFVVQYKDREEVIDVKGMQTEVYKIKRKLLLKRYPDILFKEIQ